jgi:hypothetical protein
MKRTTLTAAIFAGFAGALAPGALILIKGIVFAALWGPAARVAAFLSPLGPHRNGPAWATVLVDALIGLSVGTLLSLAVARFAHTRNWRLGLVFLGGFLLASLALLVFRGSLGQAGVMLRQPIMLSFIAAASAIFLLFSRPAPAPGARPPAR